MIRDEIKKEIRSVLGAGEEVNFAVNLPPKGIPFDFSCNALMPVSKKTGRRPEDLFKEALPELKKSGVFEKIDFAPPGFINLSLSANRLRSEIGDILDGGDIYPRENPGNSLQVLIDFVSSNPTGPLHIGHGRGAVIGDVLARVMTHLGYRVTKEYYVNDTGRQMDILLESVRARMAQMKDENAPFPEDGYMGEYITQVAEELAGGEVTAKRIIEKILEMIKKDLADFRVTFDSWVYESTLYDNRMVADTIEMLASKGYVYEKDGALWFKSTQFGDEKDRAVKKNEGGYTYFGADIAYHYNKLQRGNKLLIDIWGQDHHGYVPRLIGSIKAMGYDEKMLKVILYQLVSLLRGGQRVRMSTRSGEFITLREVMDEIGTDAARYFLSTRTPDAQLEFDLELAKKQSPENPVYYIQYAHTRCAGILRESGKSQLSNPGAADLSLLKEEKERSLMVRMLLYPEALAASARDLTPHHISAYLLDLSGAFHNYYDSFRVITDDTGVSRARLALIKAVKTVLKNGLGMLGITAPDKM
jgi:arginyl-tRNA synthetase